MKFENKMAFYFKNTDKDIIMTEEDDEYYGKNDICRICEKETLTDKIRDHCQLTGKYRSPADSKCNIIVTQKQSSFITFAIHKFSNYDCHLFPKELVDKKNDEVNLKLLPGTDEEYTSVEYGCIKFIVSYRFLSSSLDELLKIKMRMILKF